MKDILGIGLIAVGYLAIGYVIGVPAAALLDLWTDSNDKNRLSIPATVFTWPLILLAFLALGPWALREYLAQRGK